MEKEIMVGKYLIKGEPMVAKQDYKLYKAIDTTDNKCLIIKVYSRDIIQKENDAIYKMIDIMTTIHNHDHNKLILPVREILQSTNKLYIVIDYIQGDSLRNLWTKQTLPEAALIDLLKRVIDGLNLLSAHGFVHTNLKAEHILLHNPEPTSQSTWVLTGWQYIRRFQDKEDPEVTTLHPIPEQLQGQAYSASTNVWQLGVLAYELATHSLPMDLIKQVEARTIANALRTANPKLAKLAAMCLKLDPAERPSFEVALDSLSRDSPGIEHDYDCPDLQDKTKTAVMGRELLSGTHVRIVKLVSPTAAEDYERVLEVQKGPYLSKSQKIYTLHRGQQHCVVEAFYPTLAEHMALKNKKTLSAKELYALAVFVVLGLKQIHDSNYAHLAISTQTILVTKEVHNEITTAVLTFNADYSNRMLRPPAECMAPELKTVDLDHMTLADSGQYKAADIWLFAQLLYYLGHGTVCDPTQSFATTTRLEKVLKKCFQSDPNRRCTVKKILNYEDMKFFLEEEREISTRYMLLSPPGPTWGESDSHTPCVERETGKLCVMLITRDKLKKEVEKEQELLLPYNSVDTLDKIRKFHEANQQLYIIRDYFNYTLEAYLNSFHTQISDDDIKVVAKALVQALHALHTLPASQAQAVHRSVNPSNIYLTIDGTRIIAVRLAGFKPASGVDQKMTSKVSLPGYQAPEISSISPLYNEKVDAWSYGMVLLILYNRLPTDIQTLAILEKNYPDSCHDYAMAQVQGPLQPIIAACLMVDPSQRPSFAELINNPYFA